MIDLKDLRADPDKYRKGAAAKGIALDIDLLLDLDARLRGAQAEKERLTAEKNQSGKRIGELAGRLKRATGEERAALEREIETLKARPAQIKHEEAALDQTIAQLEPQRDDLWLRTPQPPDADVPPGRTSADNIEIRRWNPSWFDPSRPFAGNKGFEPKSHIELGESLGIIDFERGVKLSGARSYILRGDGMLLHQAALRFAFDFMVHDHGFTGVSAPPLVRESVLIGTGFFPHGKEDVYHIANSTSEDQLYLTGTGEAGLMALHQDEILSAEQLPLTYTTVSTCFRREAGSAGKDTAGLYRIHQFDKVEQVVICKADEAESRNWHKKMIAFVEALLQKLEIPYRLLQCCTGDLGPKNADMIDIESWMPSREGYGETHSASRLYDYQCRRLNLRYKDPATGRNLHCHSLNNTVLASPRILIPILELYQNEDGSVTVPIALRPYMGGRERIG